MREFPKMADIHPGETLIADCGFTCLSDGESVAVEQDDGGLYVRCAGPDEGDNAEAEWGAPATAARSEKHYLDGQENEAGECVGFWKA